MVNYMNKNFLVAFVVVLLLGIGIYGVTHYSAPRTENEQNEAAEDDVDTYTYTYLTSTQDTTAYCDGATMGSDGYRATITEQHTGTIAKAHPTTEEIVRATIDAATTGMCHTVMSQTTFTVNDGVVTIAPIDAWAGASITMCSCAPQVEVNLLRIPGITGVVWANGSSVSASVVLDTPLAHATVKNPITFSGKARGSWYFEGTFPVYLIDAHGNILAQTVARAQSDWTTDAFVSFTGVLTFTADPLIVGDAATFVLAKDNPSGLPENDEPLRVPVTIGTGK